MLFSGKEVLTVNSFSYSTARPGDYVTQAVVDGAMDCLPPACMTSVCSQMGEPYSHRLDPDTGRWRATYATFRRITDGPRGIWQYCGHCFRGETMERWHEPSSVSKPEKERPQLILPVEGEVYHNRCGSDYRCCTRLRDGDAIMVRIPDGWTCLAHGIRQYKDGTIEWDGSSGGHWPV